MRLTDSEFRRTSTSIGCLFQRRLGIPHVPVVSACQARIRTSRKSVVALGTVRSCSRSFKSPAIPSSQTTISALTFKERIMKSLNGTPAPSLCLRGTAAIVLVLCGLILASGCRKSDSETHPSSVEKSASAANSDPAKSTEVVPESPNPPTPSSRRWSPRIRRPRTTPTRARSRSAVPRRVSLWMINPSTTQWSSSVPTSCAWRSLAAR